MTLLFLLFLVSQLAVPLLLLWHWILLPIRKITRGVRAPLQYSMADLFSLAFLASLSMTAMSLLIRGEAAEFVVVLGSAILVIEGILWFVGIRALSRANVRRPWDRCVYLVVVLPITYFGSVAFVVIMLLLFWERDLRNEYAFVAAGLLAASFPACRIFVDRMVASACKIRR